MKQNEGTEYSGVSPTAATIQPKGAEALTPGDRLRLGYLTGSESDPDSMEDRRQFYGLKPAGESRPKYLRGTGQTTQAQIAGIDET